MASDIKIVIDDAKLKTAVDNAESIGQKLRTVTRTVINNANNMSAGFRTEKYRRKDGTEVGDTQPRYGGNAQRYSGGYIGIVYPKNYAAMKDNHLHNTILKALGVMGDV